MQNDIPGTSGQSVGAAGVLPAPRRLAMLDEWLDRLRLTTPFARDCALAFVIALLGAGMDWLLVGVVAPSEGIVVPPGQAAAVLAVSTVQSLLLCIRRIRPVLCLILVVIAQVTIIAILPVGFGFRGFAAFVAAYTVGVMLPARPAFRVIAAVVLFEVLAGLAASLFLAAPADGSGPIAVMIGGLAGLVPLLALNLIVSAVLTYLAAALVGSYVATRRDYVELIRVRATEAIREQQARADAAIGAERSRMARELHDIAAHHLSGMVVQAGAVERLIDKDPQAAKDGTAWIRAQGKETLANLRLVVGVLREPSAPRNIDSAPVPGIGALDDLLETVRSLGGSVDLVRDGEPYPLAPIADTTLYRVLQEALSNARQHAPGQPIRVTLTYRASSVMLEVENPRGNNRPTDARSGLGLVGMRERAQILGARLDAGPTERGWRISLVVPVEREGRDTEFTERNTR